MTRNVNRAERRWGCHDTARLLEAHAMEIHRFSSARQAQQRGEFSHHQTVAIARFSRSLEVVLLELPSLGSSLTVVVDYHQSAYNPQEHFLSLQPVRESTVKSRSSAALLALYVA